MLFGRRQAGSRREVDASGPRKRDSETPAPQASPTLTKVLDKVFRTERPEVLDLGPFSGDTVVRLAARGARVQVDPFEPPPPTPPKEPGKPREEPLVPVVIDQPDASYDLVLVWEQLDFVPPDRLPDFGAELSRVLRQGGLLLAFSMAKKTEGPSSPARYRMVGEDQVVREVPSSPVRRRWVHPNRDIERALKGLAIQGIHLQRNQMREFFAIRKD